MADVLEIDVDEMDCRFALADQVFGKCHDDFTMRCPTELKEAFALKAAKNRQSAAWRAKFWLAMDAFGIDHVVTLIARSFPVAGPEADAMALSIVRAMVEPLTRQLPPQAAPNRRATD